MIIQRSQCGRGKYESSKLVLCQDLEQIKMGVRVEDIEAMEDELLRLLNRGE